jgi:hypothetical protein
MDRDGRTARQSDSASPTTEELSLPAPAKVSICELL